MMNVDEIIGSLLLRHNCVIIPGFGGFVAKQTSAQIDYKSGLISPPRKSLLFNRQLVNNDGLLITEFARHKAIDYTTSSDLVNQMILNWNQDLNNGNRISIDKVGFLFFDQERNICFEQDKEFNLLLSSYGLGSVHFISEVDLAILQEKIKNKEEQLKKVKEPILLKQEEPLVVAPAPKINSSPTSTQTIGITKEHTKASKNNFWKYAAAACLIPILFYSLWIPMKTDVLESKMISFHDFNPFHQHLEAQYNPKSMVGILDKKVEHVPTLNEQLSAIDSKNELYSYNFTEKTFVLVKTKPAKSTVVEKVTTENTPHSAATSYAGKLTLIVGCFSDKNNAINLVQTLISQGFQASIKDVKNGLHRVSIGSVDSEAEMNELNQKAKQLGFTGWILK